MKFVERFNKFFGRITVKEMGNLVKVTGCDGEILRQHFKIMFETDVVAKKMFTSMSDTSFSLNKFFVPDLIYMLTKLHHDEKTTWSGKRTIDKIVVGLLQNTWYKISQGEVKPIIDMKRLNMMKWTAMPKQIEFLHLFGDRMPRYDLRGYIIGFAPGGGKTFLDLCVAECVIPPDVAEIKIIISPKKALHLVWEKTINAVFKKVPTYWCCDSGIPMPEKNVEYYIFNFEQLDRAIELGKKLLAQGKRYFTIVDESHNFADFKSARTQKLVKLQTLHPDLLFLWTSGSPILKTAAELTSFLKCSDHRFDADAERRFKQIYSAAPGRANEIFNHRLGLMMAFMVGKSAFSPTKPTVKELPVKLPPAIAHKFLMSTVREEMKAFIEERVEIYRGKIKEMRKTVQKYMDYHENTLTTKAERKAFNQYQKNLKIIMRAPDLMLTEVLTAARTYERTKLLPSIPPVNRSEFRNALSAVKNIKLKVRGEALGTVLAKRRSECAAYLGVYCKPDQIMKESLSKTLFFASSVLPVKVLGRHLEKMGFEPLLVFADTNADLTKNIERFTEDPNVNPICATMQSLSEAVPVTAASTVVLLNRPYRQATYDQVIARADRLGQVHPVTIVEVTLDTGGEPNVSSTADDILASVREYINVIVGPEFAGPDPDEREYKEVIDASGEKHSIDLNDDEMGL
jgi:hypothetical protein